MKKTLFKNSDLWQNIITIVYTISFWRFIRYFIRDKIIILCYHNISSTRSVLNPTITPQVFTQQMEHLKKYYNVITMDECIAALNGKQNIKPYSIIISFDDGYISQYKIAFPIIKQLGLSAIYYINESFIGSADIFWWEELEYIIMNCKESSLAIEIDGYETVFELKNHYQRIETCELVASIFQESNHSNRVQLLYLFRKASGVKIYNDKTFIKDYSCLNQNMIKEMKKSKMSIGSHTMNHPFLSNETYETQKIEIKNSINYLDKSNPMHFCFPHGDYNTDTIQILKSVGFQSAVTVKGGFVEAGDDLFTLKRWIPKSNISEFVVDISGTGYFINKFKRLIKK